MRYFFGLGSNLGDKKRNLTQALRLLTREGITLVRASSIYKSQPVGYGKQPWFYNQVVEVSAHLQPVEMLRLIKKIERQMLRMPTLRNRPRPIDIDILLAEDQIIKTDELVIPHPRLEKRNFVLIPLVEISPDTVHPLFKEKMADLWKKSKDPSRVERLRSAASKGFIAEKSHRRKSCRKAKEARASVSRGEEMQ